jgi:hypothetical protein
MWAMIEKFLMWSMEFIVRQLSEQPSGLRRVGSSGLAVLRQVRGLQTRRLKRGRP